MVDDDDKDSDDDEDNNNDNDNNTGAGRCHRVRLLRYVEASWQCKRMAIGCPLAVRAE
jgi:hypothetical protein